MLYPIALELAGRPVLVVGLGGVGRRKAAGLVEAGARVLAIDPAGGEAPEGVTLRAEPYRAEHLSGISLAFAAAPPEVNRRVVADARAAGIWVNAASEPEAGDFRVPAVWRSGPILLGITTSGASPALAASLRDRAAEALGPAPALLAEALLAVRAEVRTREPDPVRRRLLFSGFDDPRWLVVAESGDAEALDRALRSWLRDALGERQDPSIPGNT